MWDLLFALTEARNKIDDLSALAAAHFPTVQSDGRYQHLFEVDVEASLSYPSYRTSASTCGVDSIVPAGRVQSSGFKARCHGNVHQSGWILQVQASNHTLFLCEPMGWSDDQFRSAQSCEMAVMANPIKRAILKVGRYIE